MISILKFFVVLISLFSGIFPFTKNYNNYEYIEEINEVEEIEDIDNIGFNELEYDINVALQYLFENLYGDKIYDARIYVERIYTKEEEQEIEELKNLNLGPNDYAFEVLYSIKPSSNIDIGELMILDGEYDQYTEWIDNIERVGIISYIDEESGYRVTKFGPSF